MDTIINRAQEPTKENDANVELENQEWIESLDYVLANAGAERVVELMERLQTHAQLKGVTFPFSANTPYINTISADKTPPYPGSREIERRIKSILRWNAMAMVVRANKTENGIGGHISTYASAATLYEVAFNHFLRGKNGSGRGDMVYFQGHASPGIYARAFLEGRLTEEQLTNFRRELHGGLSSYPHPWLMPDFWEFPTVSMGLGPIMSIYQARFNKYLVNRGLAEPNDRKVWAFLGDGETDEPESLGSISLAAREKLDNLVWVINCNLQRLDGPVRGNGKVIQELEANFRGVGWNVIKVVWGSDWDELFARDEKGILVQRATEVIDGEYQKYIVEPGSYVREHFFGKNPELLKMVENLSDEQLYRMRRGGHDPEKVYAAYELAMRSDKPTVILAKTIKGYGLGEAGEGRNITHQQKKLNEEELREFRTRFGIPISDEDVAKAPFYRPADDSPEIQYLTERRKALGGSLPQRLAEPFSIPSPDAKAFEEFQGGSGGRELSTTMAFVRLLGKLLKDKEIGKYVVPIVPDEARTFGMEALFRQCGIYSSVGQLYDPVDSDQLLFYKETKNGQILEEGITEAGSMSSFIAAGTSYATHGIPTIPFFIFYSMFGMQRIGDLVWAAADMRCKGFMLGATAGRTTLNGEGLQHQDGNSQLLALPVPNLVTYDPAYAYEIEVIIKDGIRRMYQNNEDIFYYITVENENYEMPAKPEGCDEGILKGGYLFRDAGIQSDSFPTAKILGSGSLMREAILAQEMLEEKYGVPAQVYSITSYKELRREALECERYNMLHPGEEEKVPYLTELIEDGEDAPAIVIAVSDYVKALSDSISPWIYSLMVSLGTDGFGRSETREALRDFFEVDHRYIVLSALGMLHRDYDLDIGIVEQAMTDLKINPDKLDPTKA